MGQKGAMRLLLDSRGSASHVPSLSMLRMGETTDGARPGRRRREVLRRQKVIREVGINVTDTLWGREGQIRNTPS